MSTRLITLITDFGHADPFVGVMKGVIATIAPEARVIDLCHEVPRGDVRAASFFLSISHGYFPAGTIHVAVVDPGVGGGRHPIALAYNGRFFVGPDNGIFSHLLSNRKPEKIVHLTESRFHLAGAGRSFDGRDLFAPVAAYLASGVPLTDLGRPLHSLKRLKLEAPRKQGGTLVGRVEWVDRFGNLITDLTPALIAEKLGKPSYLGRVRVGKEGALVKWGRAYSDAKKGGLVAFINAWDRLEIAVNNGSASDVLQANVGTPVIVGKNAGQSDFEKSI